MSSRRKILLVDDSPIVRAVVTHALSASGFEVRSVDDPRGLDAAVAEHAPELLLVDATFPGVSDAELVGALQRHVEALPIVLFSDRSEAELHELSSQIGARGFVPKDGVTLAERLAPFLTR